MSIATNTAEVQFNFRKLRQEFSSASLKEGKRLYEKKGSCQAQITSCSPSSFIIEASVVGFFSDPHSCQLEIERSDSSLSLSHCDCSSEVDCHHIACALFFIEENFHRMLLDYLESEEENQPKKADVKKVKVTDQGILEAKKTSERKLQQEKEKLAVKEFVDAAALLAQSSLLTKREEAVVQADLFINIGPIQSGPKKMTEISFAVKLPEKAKPVAILQPKLFFQSLLQEDPLFLGSTLAVLSMKSFGPGCFRLLETLRHSMEFIDRTDKVGKAAFISQEMVEGVFVEAARISMEKSGHIHLFSEQFEKPYVIHHERVNLEFFVSLIQEPSERLMVQARVLLPEETVSIRNVRLMRASSIVCLKDQELFLFDEMLHPKAKDELGAIDTIVIPPSLFGSFFSYSLPELQKIGAVRMSSDAEKLSLKEFEKRSPRLRLNVNMSNSALVAQVQFFYSDRLFPEARACKKWSEIGWGEESQATFARDVCQETRLIHKSLWGFVFDEKTGHYSTTSERKIHEFFIETMGSQIGTLDLQISSTLRPYVSLEPSVFQLDLELKECAKVHCTLRVKGSMKGVSLQKLFEAARLRRGAIEADVDMRSPVLNKRYVLLGSSKVEAIASCFDELSIPRIEDCEWEVPLWMVLGMNEKLYQSAGIEVVYHEKILEIKKELLQPAKEMKEELYFDSSCVVKGYQKEGVHWLRRLRRYYLGGILADDMGLGKTLQTIGILADLYLKDKASRPSLIVCPTSLIDNWQMEIKKFQPDLHVIPLCGTPQERKKIVDKNSKHHIFLATYGLVQKDAEFLSQIPFSYIILDEGQAIKNKETFTARAVKQLKADHRLILTGTPVENSLEDLWSLFDFLMPSFLGSYDKFSTLYLKVNDETKETVLEQLKKKVQPFILRRMKQEVLKDLPSITHTMLHCSLVEKQSTLYEQFASQAKEELKALVERDGYDKARIHVLATLTRLKQICCHPQLLQECMDTKEIESAKYELLFELVDKIRAAKKKAVIFSQYAKMLNIIKQKFDERNISSMVLDGSTKNRLSIVQKFNEDANVSFFLVSLRAGGNGLNLVGADTVIHYDLWWNPAVENQATDRVWRMGQKEPVQSYKLITKGTIEEKIIQLQEKKKDVIANIIESDEDVMSKLSWNDVLELLGGK